GCLRRNVRLAFRLAFRLTFRQTRSGDGRRRKRPAGEHTLLHKQPVEAANSQLEPQEVSCGSVLSRGFVLSRGPIGCWASGLPVSVGGGTPVFGCQTPDLCLAVKPLTCVRLLNP